jgi:hypothetical protein
VKAPYDKAVCPDCGQHLLDWDFLAEEVLRSTKDGTVYGTHRIFPGRCPIHGVRWASYYGNHSSVGENSKPELTKRYGKQKRRIKAALSEPDRTNFKNALKGMYRPSDEELARWDAAQAASEP